MQPRTPQWSPRVGDRVHRGAHHLLDRGDLAVVLTPHRSRATDPPTTPIAGALGGHGVNGRGHRALQGPTSSCARPTGSCRGAPRGPG